MLDIPRHKYVESSECKEENFVNIFQETVDTITFKFKRETNKKTYKSKCRFYINFYLRYDRWSGDINEVDLVIDESEWFEIIFVRDSECNISFIYIENDTKTFNSGTKTY